MPGDIDGGEWLHEIREHYGSADVTPFDVACEILLGQQLPTGARESIVRRGLKVGDELMSNTTDADVEDAVEELISFGFLEQVFSAGCTHASHGPFVMSCEERVLELRLP